MLNKKNLTIIGIIVWFWIFFSSLLFVFINNKGENDNNSKSLYIEKQEIDFSSLSQKDE